MTTYRTSEGEPYYHDHTQWEPPPELRASEAMGRTSGNSRLKPGHVVLFVWSKRAPSLVPDWNPVILTRGALECCNIMLALRHFGVIVSSRFFKGGPPPNIARFADLVMFAEPIREHLKIDG